ncbi:dTDP-4-amino-4,6-dideoxygalactose transaminase [Anaeroselena agilis]|uniref:dTDP-4-amino-4,6-dideoxygalactose transaminase n=1 Tax=Anaeroselena agilis TaxID=3063788 RepID=A0ABU3NSF7_9FIRM|nr:dTDP-4-amino-4,6-dideoxygalactose transaminase [Selenomonadales bacterium 4137-cl]
MNIPFNKLFVTARETEFIQDAVASGCLTGDGRYTRLCHAWLEENTGCAKALLAHSCTGALEMAAVLANIGPGDEVIMPSYTFVSTANAFVLRGAVPVFVDIRPDTQNLDERKIAAAVTARTKAIVPVHYAGVACEMDGILQVAGEHRLLVIEDAAQGVLSTYKGKALGAIGAMGTLSFHGSKNIAAGEGGALLINDDFLGERAEIIREKGTNRSRFFRGEVDKYTWVDIGSSYLPSELNAAFLWAQLQSAEEIQARRMRVWETYFRRLGAINSDLFRLPVCPPECGHNAHIFYVLFRNAGIRQSFIQALKERGIDALFHYIPLHLSPAGRRYGRVSGRLENTEAAGEGLVRLPLWAGMSAKDVDYVCETVTDVVKKLS